MGATNFPNGISVNGLAEHSGVTNVTGAGTITTNLDSVTGVITSLGTALSATTFTCMGTAHAAASGAATFIARVYNSSATAGTVLAPVVWTAYGTKA